MIVGFKSTVEGIEPDVLPAEEATYIKEISGLEDDSLYDPTTAAYVIAALCRRLAVVESILRRLPPQLL